MTFTQCPKCKTLYRVSAKELRSGRGQVFCHECQAPFNALEALSDQPREAERTGVGERSERLPVLDIHHAIPIEVPNRGPFDGAAKPLPSMSATRPRKAVRRANPVVDDDALHQQAFSLFGFLAWGVSSLLLAAMLVVQVYVFEVDRLSQNADLRPWLDLFCELAECSLPDFRATENIKIVNRSLRPTSDDIDGLEFNLVIANQSPLAQAFPSLKLSLTGTSGQILQARVFQPADYLPDPVAQRKMPVGKPFSIKLLLARPESEVGGFIFDLI